MLHLFATLPVTTATNERSISTLQRLLAYLRSTSMGKNQARNELEQFSAPLEKCVGHTLKLLDTGQ